MFQNNEDELVEEDELEDPCSPYNCELSFERYCYLICTRLICQRCKRYRDPCDKIEQLTYLKGNQKEDLIGFIPELKQKEICKLETRINKCLIKRWFLQKEKGYSCFYNEKEYFDILYP